MRSLRQNAAPTAALLLLCLLWALPSLRSDLIPGSISEGKSSSLLHDAVTLALFALVAATTSFMRRRAWPRGSALLVAVLVGVGLFALPALLIQLANGYLDESTRVALFSLTPVFALAFEPHFGSASQSQPGGSFPAALVAVAGTLLIFPVELPQAFFPALAFAGVILASVSVGAANCIAVKIARSRPTLSISAFAAIASAVPAIVLALAALPLKHHLAPASQIDVWTIPDLLALALLFWLLRRMSAVRMTTRFLIAPLVANLIALAYLRPEVQARAWLGLLLIGAGSGWLLFAPENEPEEPGSTLGIS